MAGKRNSHLSKLSPILLAFSFFRTEFTADQCCSSEPIVQMRMSSTKANVPGESTVDCLMEFGRHITNAVKTGYEAIRAGGLAATDTKITLLSVFQGQF